jgi:hypothetical protein
MVKVACGAFWSMIKVACGAFALSAAAGADAEDCRGCGGIVALAFH